MKILKSILYTIFVLLISTEIIFAQDFKIAPNTPLPESSSFFNVSIASDTNNGFLVTWINEYHQGASFLLQNYACRISKAGEMLDTAAIYLCKSNWPHYCPSAVFAGGNWVFCSQQGSLYEYVQAMRLTPSGEVLDTLPVNICNSIGMATILYPIIETNGQEILCVTGIAGEGQFGSIFDSDLNILVDRFPIYKQTVSDLKPRVAANRNNFFITFLNSGIKLVIVNPAGQILSIQNVDEEGSKEGYYGAPTITTLNDTTYITYFGANTDRDASALWMRRYSSEGNPIDSSPVKIVESQDFDLVLEEISISHTARGYTELVWANENFCFFWPRISDLGMSMMSFKPDLSTGKKQSVLLNSQCHICFQLRWDHWETPTQSYSVIRALSLGNKVLTTWIDGREGYGRVYGNLFNVNAYTGLEQKTNPIMITKNFSISQNYPNPFNSSTKIKFVLPKQETVKIEVYNTLGQNIKTLLNRSMPAGHHQVEFKSQNFPSGVYLYRIGAGAFQDVKKMILLR